jgi:hypothetical protein
MDSETTPHDTSACARVGAEATVATAPSVVFTHENANALLLFSAEQRMANCIRNQMRAGMGGERMRWQTIFEAHWLNCCSNGVADGKHYSNSTPREKWRTSKRSRSISLMRSQMRAYLFA